MEIRNWQSLAFAFAIALSTFATGSAATPDDDFFKNKIQPILSTHCFDCHGDGADEGGVELDQLLADKPSTETKRVWQRVLKQVRADLMPPSDSTKLNAQEKQTLKNWIIRSSLELDPANPHPGRVTVRRLNRVEYQNTIKALTGVDFDTSKKFPADDTGHGFDNNGDVLTVSPLLLEKYFDAAKEIISAAIPLPSTDSTKQRPRSSAAYKRFFPRPIPDNALAKRKYAREILTKFASRAFRRPVDGKTSDRLVQLAESSYKNGTSFEASVAQAMTAVLASPRFMFREERESANQDQAKNGFPLLDEFSLASRLSYFLWSSMPDEKLFELASKGQLRENLDQQVERMVADQRFDQFVLNFGGQWLQARSILTTHVNPRAVLSREVTMTPEDKKRRAEYLALREKDDQRSDLENRRFKDLGHQLGRQFRRLGPQALDWRIRESMKRETDMYLDYVLRQNRSLLDLLDSNYTFVDERLARHYGIEGVKGPETRRVTIPESSVRGGVLTQGTILVTTSNPDRTSPVKRGVFVLENLLGTPTASPPPNTPSLEASATDGTSELSLRESLQLHRDHPNCISCHKRMDPLGLALESFNAIGKYRTTELGERIDVTGELATGEAFEGIIELKKILRQQRADDFYRCITEKVMTYALGREITYRDIPAIDKIVKRLQANGGQATHLIRGVIESNAFQQFARDDAETESPSKE